MESAHFDDNDLEINEEGNNEPTADGEEGEEQNDDEAEEAKKVKPRKIVRNPQPKLNHETLKSERGITALESYFERVRFKGRGHEEQDLNVILKTYEYWCHRLFPKYPFEDCIEKIEKLGAKRIVQVHVKKIRLDMLTEDRVANSDDENDVETQPENNELDLLGTAELPQAEPELTEDQQERIRLNREKAEKLRQERLKKIQNTAQSSLSQSSQLPAQTSRHESSDEGEDMDSFFSKLRQNSTHSPQTSQTQNTSKPQDESKSTESSNSQGRKSPREESEDEDMDIIFSKLRKNKFNELSQSDDKDMEEGMNTHKSESITQSSQAKNSCESDIDEENTNSASMEISREVQDENMELDPDSNEDKSDETLRDRESVLVSLD